jgi:hypothetical protein
MALLNLGGSLREFGFKSSPCVVVVVGVLLLDEPKGFFGAQLCNPREVPHPEAIQHFSSLQLALTQTQRAFHVFTQRQ